jgi:AcrR family transcriptional regulator
VDSSRRERKKQLTRERIVSEAIRLFDRDGYEKTTVAQIAEAADIDPKTFFNYFPSKDEVLFNELDLDVDDLLAAIAARRGDERPGETLSRAILQYAAGRRRAAPRRHAEELSAAARLSFTTPALQAKAVYLMLDLQQRIATALQEAFAPGLDALTAAALTGAAVGAVQQVTLTGVGLGLSQHELWDAAERALEVASVGLGAAGTAALGAAANAGPGAAGSAALGAAANAGPGTAPSEARAKAGDQA